MKKSVLFLSAVSMVALSSVAFAGNPDTGPGCGLGKLAWDGYKNQKNIGPQVMMATTNGTFGSGTFGISSGTSGCTNDGQVFTENKSTMFANLNFENLAQDMAKGQGENLASLATLMGVPAEQQGAFFSLAQEKYQGLVEAGQASPVALIKALNDAMVGSPMLAQVVR
ncbi:MAG: DUF3015 domain-containing protein [Nitrospiraceae bacterium]